MSLLVDIAANALEPGYAAAQRRPRNAPTAATTRIRRRLLAGGGILAATLLIVIAGVHAHRQVPASTKTRQTLVTQVRTREAAVTRLQARLDRLRAETDRLRTATLVATGAGSRLATRLSIAGLAAGTEAVRGPGLSVSLNDAAPRPDGSQNKVLDRDLQSVVNAVWAAGAEAVAVDGQRLTAESAIRSAGGALLVNFVPLTPPYDVEAVGDSVAMETAFATSGAAGRMRAAAQVYGLGFHYSRVPALTLPAASGITLRYSRPIPPFHRGAR